MLSWPDVFNWTAIGLGCLTVAAVSYKAVDIALDNSDRTDKKGNPGNWLSRELRKELEGKYGHWAVETAIGVCPHDDIRCIEREAKRLYESRVLRR